MIFNRKKELPIVLSVGGSLIVPDGHINTDFLKQLNEFVRHYVKNGKRFFLVAGGGTIARLYRDAGKEVVGSMTNEDLDWLAIHATHLNGHLLRTIFQDIAHPRIIQNYDRRLLRWREPVVIGAGWKPGWSTDYDAVLLARDYKARIIINLSNIDWVYDKDPAKFKDAQPIKKITWDEMENLVGNKWVPGLNMPFDPIATKLAKKLNLTVIVVNGDNFSNLEKVIEGNEFVGTVITPYKIDASFYDRKYYTGKKGEHRLGYAESKIGRIWHGLINFYRALLIKIFINPKNCLDVGCGTGRLVKSLRFLGIEAYGVEISQAALELAHEKVKNYLKEGDILKLPYEDNQFDLVLTFDVLEHIERSKLKKAVSELMRVSRKHVLNKIYTTENSWIDMFHAHDYSHVTVMVKKFWQELFNSIDNLSVLRGGFFRLPSFFETVFLLKKKNS